MNTYDFFSVSIICMDPLKLGEYAFELVNMGITQFHADFMDGKFVPRLGLYPEIIKSLKEASEYYPKPILIDSHLMLDAPYSMVDSIAPYSDTIFFHVESASDPIRLLQYTKKNYPNVRCGLAYNIATPIIPRTEGLKPYIDAVMLMGISPGVLGGSTFPLEVEVKVQDVRKLCGDVKIFVDGSVNFDTLPLYRSIGVDTVILGSSTIFKGADNILKVYENMEKLKCLIEK